MKTPLYLDYAATTPIDKRVLAVMEPLLQDLFGNPSSLHIFGQQAEKALEDARRSLAENLGADPEEIVFTSSGSESDNLALRGTALARWNQEGLNRIIISPLEHPAVQVTANQLAAQQGFEVETLPVNQAGQVVLDQIDDFFREPPALVSVMAANNEVGTLNPIEELGSRCRENGIPFHTDAVQYGAHYPLDLQTLPVDLLSLGAHKFYGPKGVGALYIRKGTPLLPVLTGGSQEFGLRASTENVPLIAGMAKAYQLVREESAWRQEHSRDLRDKIISFVLDNIPGSQLTGGSLDDRLPNHASFIFENLTGNLLIQVLDQEGIACSSGSACKTGDPRPSSVLTQLGYTPEQALGSLRISIGKDTTAEEVNRLLQILPDSVQRTREVEA